MTGGTAGTLPKSVGNTVYGADYNAVHTIINGILGTNATYGTGYGYNQSLVSSAVSATAKVTSAQWTTLVTDVSTVYLHQNGVSYTSVSPTVGSTISASNINTLNTVAGTLLASRFTANAGQLTSAQVAQPTYATAWGGGGAGIQSITNVAVGAGGGATNAQYFFNQGGKIVVSGYTLSGWSTVTTQNLDWYNAMVAMSVTISSSTYASILASGATYIQLYSNASFPSPYTANFVHVYANTADSGASINVRITYEDNHVSSGGGPDTVNGGTIGATFTAYHATGAFTGVIPSASVTTAFTAGTYVV